MRSEAATGNTSIFGKRSQIPPLLLTSTHEYCRPAMTNVLAFSITHRLSAPTHPPPVPRRAHFWPLSGPWRGAGREEPGWGAGQAPLCAARPVGLARCQTQFPDPSCSENQTSCPSTQAGSSQAVSLAARRPLGLQLDSPGRAGRGQVERSFIQFVAYLSARSLAKGKGRQRCGG